LPRNSNQNLTLPPPRMFESSLPPSSTSRPTEASTGHHGSGSEGSQGKDLSMIAYALEKLGKNQSAREIARRRDTGQESDEEEEREAQRDRERVALRMAMMRRSEGAELRERDRRKEEDEPMSEDSGGGGGGDGEGGDWDRGTRDGRKVPDNTPASQRRAPSARPGVAGAPSRPSAGPGHGLESILEPSPPVKLTCQRCRLSHVICSGGDENNPCKKCAKRGWLCEFVAPGKRYE
jgi:hypothetical protein